MEVTKIFGNKFNVTIKNEEELKAFEALDGAAMVCDVVQKKKITHITYGMREEEAIHSFFARRKKIQNRRNVKVEDLATLMMTNAYA